MAGGRSVRGGISRAQRRDRRGRRLIAVRGRRPRRPDSAGPPARPAGPRRSGVRPRETRSGGRGDRRGRGPGVRPADVGMSAVGESAAAASGPAGTTGSAPEAVGGRQRPGGPATGRRGAGGGRRLRRSRGEDPGSAGGRGRGRLAAGAGPAAATGPAAASGCWPLPGQRAEPAGRRRAGGRADVGGGPAPRRRRSAAAGSGPGGGGGRRPGSGRLGPAALGWRASRSAAARRAVGGSTGSGRSPAGGRLRRRLGPVDLGQEVGRSSVWSGVARRDAVRRLTWAPRPSAGRWSPSNAGHARPCDVVSWCSRAGSRRPRP